MLTPSERPDTAATWPHYKHGHLTRLRLGDSGAAVPSRRGHELVPAGDACYIEQPHPAIIQRIFHVIIYDPALFTCILTLTTLWMHALLTLDTLAGYVNSLLHEQAKCFCKLTPAITTPIKGKHQASTITWYEIKRRASSKLASTRVASFN